MNVSVQGIENISRELYRRAGLLATLMPLVANEIQEEITDNFLAYGRWNGTTTDILSGGTTKWAPLAKSTIAKYKAGKKIRIFEPTLSRSSGGLADVVQVSAQGMRVVVSARKKYARIHQLGGDIKHPGGTPYINLGNTVRFLKKDGKYPEGVQFTKPHTIHIPARPYIVISRAALDRISDTLSRRMARM